MAVEERQSGEGAKSLVVVNFPTGREMLWLGPDSALLQSEAGETVIHRNRAWFVSETVRSDGQLSLRLIAIET